MQKCLGAIPSGMHQITHQPKLMCGAVGIAVASLSVDTHHFGNMPVAGRLAHRVGCGNCALFRFIDI